jgi:hypothetical protein
MATPGVSTDVATAPKQWPLALVAKLPRMRALAWDGDVLYASHAYTVLRAQMGEGSFDWKIAGSFRPAWWRNLTATSRLSCRLFRDGFHALAVLNTGHMIGAVPGAIVSMAPGETEFRVSHPISRGTRPLHIASTPDRLFWGEYFDNPEREEVHIYASQDCGLTWDVAYTFGKGTIRHVHNIVYDEWRQCLWVLTGDEGSECKILRASLDFGQVDTVLSGNQQARAVALVPTQDAVFFSSDTPFESNHVYRLDRDGKLTPVTSLASSSIYCCQVGEALFFSTMVEPSPANPTKNVSLHGSPDGSAWLWRHDWQKDRWPMGLFQYGSALLPDGKNTTNLLAVTTVAVDRNDLETSVWRV